MTSGKVRRREEWDKNASQKFVHIGIKLKNSPLAGSPSLGTKEALQL